MSIPNFILCIDDEEDVLETVNVMLEEKYPHLTLVKDIPEAKEKLEHVRYACILVDININGTNGAEIIQYIRNERPSDNDKASIVIMSGFMDGKFKEKFKDKVEGVISKPFSDEELQKVIEDAIKKRSPSRKVFIETDDGEIAVEVFDPNICSPFAVKTLDTKINKTINEIRGKKEFVKLLKDICTHKDHLVLKRTGLLINICSAILKELDWASSKNLEKFIYASYLHDVALGADQRFISYHCAPEKFDDYHPDDKEKALLHHHPIASAMLVQSLNFISQDTLNIINQHHELPDGSGYPKGIDHQRITPMAAIFIVAQHFCNYILANPSWKMDAFIESHSFLMKGPHFKKAMRVLEKLK